MMKMRLNLSILVLISIVVSMVFAAPSWELGKDLEELDDVHLAWKYFKQAFNRQYSTEQEEQKRFQIFQDNFRFIKDHNDNQYNTGKASFALGINHLADLSHVERQKLNGLDSSKFRPHSYEIYTDNDVSKLPVEVNWLLKGVVAPIKNQAECGGCWAFSAVAAMEPAHAIKTGNLVELSEQELIDCVENANGCYGGFPWDGYQYVIDNNGIDTERSYPYKGINEACRNTEANKTIGATFSSFVMITGGEPALQSAVANIGPISVGIDASSILFHFYKNGVYDNPKCSQTQLDHGVAVVGYGVQDGQDYWLVRNSWGPYWGLDGYVLMSRNKNNQCGIADSPSYPIV